jgi:hypothetical protein
MQNYQQIGDAAFQGEMNNGSEPAVAMDTAVEAVGGQMAEDGFPANIIEAATNGAVEEFNQVMDQGGEPNDAYSSAYDAGVAGGQEQFGDDMPDLDSIGIEAFSAALEGGASPAEAAEAAGGAVAQAAGEAGFPAEVIEAAMEAGAASFSAAMEAGGDPQEAFANALEEAGDTAETILNDAGVGPMTDENMGTPDSSQEEVATADTSEIDTPAPEPDAEAGTPDAETGSQPGEAGEANTMKEAPPTATEEAPAPVTDGEGFVPGFGSDAALEAGGAEAAAAANEAIEVADLQPTEAGFGGAAPEVGDVGPNFDAINAEVQSVAPAVDDGPAPLDDDPTEVEVVTEIEVADEVDSLG